MDPALSLLVRVEHREWERRFNERAARGEFVKPELTGSVRPVSLVARLRELPLVIRAQVARYVLRGQLGRA